MVDKSPTPAAPAGAPAPEPRKPCCRPIVKCMSALAVAAGALGGVTYCIVKALRPAIVIATHPPPRGSVTTTDFPDCLPKEIGGLPPPGCPGSPGAMTTPKPGCRLFLGDPLDDPMYCTRGTSLYDPTCCCYDEWNLPRFVCVPAGTKVAIPDNFYPGCCLKALGTHTTLAPMPSDPYCEPHSDSSGQMYCTYKGPYEPGEEAVDPRDRCSPETRSGYFTRCVYEGCEDLFGSPRFNCTGPDAHVRPVCCPGASTSPLSLDPGLTTSSAGGRLLRGSKTLSD